MFSFIPLVNIWAVGTVIGANGIIMVVIVHIGCSVCCWCPLHPGQWNNVVAARSSRFTVEWLSFYDYKSLDGAAIGSKTAAALQAHKHK